MDSQTVFDCQLIYLPRIRNRSGNITAVQNNKEVPFEIRRVFYLYDVPGGESRGAHAHYSCHQLLLAVSGSFEILLDDGSVKRQLQLNRPDMGLHVPPGIWASEVNFSSGAICLVLASEPYQEHDYIRDYETYLHYKKTDGPER